MKMKPSEALAALKMIINILHFGSSEVREVIQDILDGKHDPVEKKPATPVKEVKNDA